MAAIISENIAQHGIWKALQEMAGVMGKNANRVESMTDDEICTGPVIEAVGIPTYVDDVTQYPDFNLQETGWYIFARIFAKDTMLVTNETTVEGAAYTASAGDDHVCVAVRFDVAAVSQKVTVKWGNYTESFIFKATDLAVRNLDYRVTFYVYDIAPYATWEYALTEDTTFAEDKYYYTKNGDTYTLATVTAGEEVPADTYYNHSKVTFEGMARNVTYVCNTPIDCPVVFKLPEIEDETHGCWFEIRFEHTGSFSSTLEVPEGVKVATEHTQPETKGINSVDLHYTAIGNTKVWRFLNTHSTLPTATS